MSHQDWTTVTLTKSTGYKGNNNNKNTNGNNNKKKKKNYNQRVLMKNKKIFVQQK